VSLRNLRLPTATVETPGGNFAVRGLSLSDCMVLAAEHGPALVKVFESAKAEVETLDDKGLATIAKSLLSSAPLACAHMIALAAQTAGEEPAIEEAASLPVPFQIDALVKVAKLTFVSEAVAKNLVETVVEAAVAAAKFRPPAIN
jgi:hypothetical protein